VAGCASSKKKKKGDDKQLLTALAVEKIYSIPDDIKKVQIRAGWIDMRWTGRGISYRFSAGRLQPMKEVFTEDDANVKAVTSVAAVVAALKAYVVEMPVGFVVTLNGALPYADKSDEIPEEFTDFVGALQAALRAEGILYTFIITRTWTTAK